MQVQSLGQEDSLKEGMAAHCSILAWGIPWTEDPGGLQSIGLQKVGNSPGNLAHVHACIVYSTVAPCFIALLVISIFTNCRFVATLHQAGLFSQQRYFLINVCELLFKIECDRA